MTTVYFIRHAESDNSVRDGRIRPLTEKGWHDRRLVTEFLQDKNIDIVFSSPFKRAVDTVSDFAEKNNFEINIIEDFRERRSDSDLGRNDINFDQFIERQWSDFHYTFSNGECLSEVQSRNIHALNEVLAQHKDKNIVIGTHGMSLSTIINYYDSTYGFDDCMAMLGIMPWAVKIEFEDIYCARLEKIDLFNLDEKSNEGYWKIDIFDLGELKAYKFVVIFSRYQNKWLYCRAKGSENYETAGGHIEQGETPLEAAKRELYEETGALKFDITPAFDYSVRRPYAVGNAQVFLAQIYELGDIPGHEEVMEEVKLFDEIPEKMRFPHILPALYEKVSAMNYI